jgi:hypothetical protein
MAKQLGAFFVSTKQQPIQPSKELNLAHIEEVRSELGYRDLVVTDQALPWMVDRFSRVLPGQAGASGQRWQRIARTVLPYSKALRTETLSPRDRARMMESFRRNVEAASNEPVRW